MMRTTVFLGIFILLSGCYFDYPLTGATQDIDTSLEGEWHDSTGEITVEVRPTADGHEIRYTDDDATYLFDNIAILEIDGDSFLQARFFGEENPDGTLDDAPKDHPWLVMAIERKDGKIIVRIPNLDDKYIAREFKNALDYRTAFAAAIRQDGFLGSPKTFEKSRP